MRLAIRPQLAACENLHGYLGRYAEANGIRTKFISDQILSSFRESREAAVRFVAHMSGSDLEAADKLISARGATANGPGRAIPGFDVGPTYLNLTKRICVQCVQRSPVVAAVWCLRYYVGCAEHGRHLVASCPRCGQGLSRQRSCHSRCQCGHDLTQVTTPDLPDDLRGLMTLVRSASLRTECGRSLPGSLAELSLPDLLRMISVTGACHESGQSNDGRSERGSPADTVSRAAPILASWPDGIRRHFRKILIDDDGRWSGRPIRLLGLLNSGAGDKDWPGRHILLSEAGKAVGGDPFAHLNPRLLKERHRPASGFVTTAEAAVILGVAPASVKRHAERYGVRSAEMFRRSQPFRFYRLTDLRKVREEADRGCCILPGYGAAHFLCGMLAVEREAIRCMAREGLLKSTQIGNAAYYSIHDAMDVILKLRRLAIGNSSGSSYRPMVAAARRWGWLDLAQIILGCYSGDIPIVLREPADGRQGPFPGLPRLDGFALDAEAVRGYAL